MVPQNAPPPSESLPPAEQTRAALEGAACVVADPQVFVVAGKDRADLLHRISSNDVRGLAPGQGHANCLTTNKGRIVDWIRLYPREDALLLLTSPGNGAEVVAWIDRYTITEDVKLQEVTRLVGALRVVGPRAKDAVAAAAGKDLALAPHAFAKESIDNLEVTVIRTEDFGDAPGYLLLCDLPDRERVSQALRARAPALAEIGAEAYEAARIRAGVPRFGRELGHDFHPLEAGLWGSVSFTKGCYVGQEVIARLNTYDKVMKNLVRLDLSGDPGADPPLKLFAEGQDAGTLTSIAGPPFLAAWCGLGYVKKRLNQGGVELRVGAADATVTARARGVVRI